MSPPTYFLHLSFMKNVDIVFIKIYRIVKYFEVIFLESNPLRFIEALISFIRAYVYCLYMPDLK